MKLKFETWLDFFIFFIFLIKIVFVISALGHIMLSLSPNKTDKSHKIDATLIYWKERTEFVFIISMAILLIYHFHPYLSKKTIDSETTFLFFLFGWVLIFTANWNLFVKEAPWYKTIVSILS